MFRALDVWWHCRQLKSNRAIARRNAARKLATLGSSRAGRLFVAKVKEVPDDRDAPGSSEGSATDASSDPSRPRRNRWFGAIFMIVGLASFAVGLSGVIDGIWFRMGADRATAVVVEVRNDGSTGWDYDILEFTVAGDPCSVASRGSFGVIFASSHGLKSRRDVWYPPNHPENARITEFSQNFGGPIVLLVLGLMFTPAGVLVLRRGIRLKSGGGGEIGIDN